MFKLCSYPGVHGNEEAERGARTCDIFKEADLNGGRSFLHFSGLQRKREPQFFREGLVLCWTLGTFFFLKSVFFYCNLNPLVMWVVEAIFLKI